METIYLALSAQVLAVGTFFMKFPLEEKKEKMWNVQ